MKSWITSFTDLIYEDGLIRSMGVIDSPYLLPSLKNANILSHPPAMLKKNMVRVWTTQQ